MILLAVVMGFLFYPAPTQGQNLAATPVPTPTSISPFAEIIGLDLVDQFRITTDEIWHVGNGSINGVMNTESDAMVLARVSLGETPGNLDDRIYIMWNIKLRAHLGFKNAGAYGGWRAEPNRWGPPTSIKLEALCNGGCQYEAVKATHGIYFPLEIYSHIRTMISPIDEKLADFYVTYMAALDVVAAPITDFPESLRGYDSFRSPSITWTGQRNREDGLLSTQYFRGGEIWRDSYPQDNVFWEEVGEREISPIVHAPFDIVDLKMRLMVIDGQLEIAQRLCDTSWIDEARFHLGIALDMTTPPILTSTPTPTITPTQTPTPTNTDLPTPTVYATVTLASPFQVKLHQSKEERNKMFDLLSQEQIIVIVTAFIIQAIKIVWVGLLKKPKPSKGHTRLLVFVVSIPLALAIGGFGVPELGENPMQFAIALMTAGGEVLMFAHIFYEAILKGALGWLDKGRALLAP